MVFSERKISIIFFIFCITSLINGYSQGIKDHMDFSKSQIVVNGELAKIERTALEMLSEEIEARTNILVSSETSWPQSSTPVIVIGIDSFFNNYGSFKKEKLDIKSNQAAEGFIIRIENTTRKAPTVFIIGNDPRGLLFGIGYFLRKISMKPNEILVPNNLNIISKPAVALRGHQLGYRPKTNSYDGFSVEMWEQYIRDLVVFGTNAIELLPPFTDDDSYSPMFPLPPMEMLIEMNELLIKYQLDTWIWYPLMHGDYTKSENIEKSLKENQEIFSKLAKIDAIFVPGGDPGHSPPKILFNYLEKKAKILHQYHPEAEMWVSPQGFDENWMNEFLKLLEAEPEWLTGIVHGPQVRMNITNLRKVVPKKYPIRRYPDITHNYDSQYPVPNWDFTFAATENRESINPRPIDQSIIFHSADLKDYKGYITYSEGVNDDVNKIIWSSLGWNPESAPLEILKEYSRYFIGPDYTNEFSHALLGLEQNWRGPLISNSGVSNTHLIFRSLEKEASPTLRLNWRFQMGLFRSYYDAYNKIRLLFETNLEEEAMTVLRMAPEFGSVLAIQRAEQILDQAIYKKPSQDLKQRLNELAESLFHSIRMQKSVDKYFAAGVRRGANLDLIDYPLNDRYWLKEQFHIITQLNEEEKRLEKIDEIINWKNPGPGGFYDDLGDLGNQPHVLIEDNYEKDPSFLLSPFVGFTIGERVKNWRISWTRHMQTLYDQPLKMHYSNLDQTAQYEVQVTYTRDLYSGNKEIQLTADGKIEVHPYIEKPEKIQPLKFIIPKSATSDGELTLQWVSELGQGGTGRGCQVAEVWLIKKKE